MSDFIGGIGTSFVIEDKATTTLVRISEGMEKVQASIDEAATAAQEFAEVRFGGLTRSVGALIDRLDQAADAAARLEAIRFGNLTRSVSALDRAVTGLSTNIDALPVAFESAMNRITVEALRGEAAINSLQAAMARTAATSASMVGGGGLVPPGGRPGGGGGGGHGAGRGHLRVGPGGVHPTGYIPLGGMGSIGGMIAGIAGYEAIKWGGEYEMGLYTAAQALGADPTSDAGKRTMQTIGDSVAQGVAGTKFAQKDLTPVLKDYYGEIISGLDPNLSPEDRAKRLQGITATSLRFAEIENLLHGRSIESEMKTSAEFSHLFRMYTPEQMGPFLDRVVAVSNLAGQDPSAMERTMKYMVTTGELSGADPSQMLDIVGFLMQSGVGGTTAGTGPAALFAALDKARAGDPRAQADIHHRVESAREQRQMFEAAMHGTFGIGKIFDEQRRGPKGDKAEAALERLGVIDPKTHDVFQKFRLEGGNLDETAIMLQMAHAAAADPKHGPGWVEMATGGQRGARSIGPFMEEGGKVFEAFVKLDQEMTKNLGVWQRQAQLADTAEQKFGQAWARLEDFGTTLMTVGGKDSLLTQLGNSAKNAADAIDSWTKWMKANPGPGAEAPGHRAVDDVRHGRMVSPSDILGGVIDWWRGRPVTMPGSHTPTLPSITPHDASPTYIPPDAGPQLHPQKQSYQAPPDVHVHIQNISFGPGTAEDHAQQFSKELSRALSDAMMHDLGTGWGHGQSSYTTGRTVSI